MLRAAGKTTAMIGTIEYHLAGRVLKAVNTTPESLDLLRLFAELESAGGTHVTMEVSSHALALGRVYGLNFHTTIFTNLTRDHLDFHGDMDDLFRRQAVALRRRRRSAAALSPCSIATMSGRADIKVHPKTEVLWYGLGPEAGLRPRHIASSFGGLRFDLQFGKLRFPIESPLIGKINVYNILAACAAGLSYGLAPEVIARGIASLKAVPGRFERVDEGQPFVVVVDYAHTDDALRNVIAVARGLNPKRVITLFGCGGDRDRAKRPLMGQAAAEGSDFVVLTSDNPRSEDPLAIMNDALVGIRRVDVPHVVEPDRAGRHPQGPQGSARRRYRHPGRQRPRDLSGAERQNHRLRRPRRGERSAEGVWVSQDPVNHDPESSRSCACHWRRCPPAAAGSGRLECGHTDTESG